MFDLDLPYSACVGRNCRNKLDCHRYLLFEYGLPDGCTYSGGVDNENDDCKSFIQRPLMTVKELIKALERFDQNAEVKVLVKQGTKMEFGQTRPIIKVDPCVNMDSNKTFAMIQFDELKHYLHI